MRLPKTLHATLAMLAENEGVSLNQFVVGALSAAVNWRSPVLMTGYHLAPGQVLGSGVVTREKATPGTG